nr:TorF family putative porin [Methylomonas sp. SURF-2]
MATVLLFLAQPASGADAPFSAHAGLVSRYVARGITTTYFNGPPLGNKNADAPESAEPAAQWGFDYAAEQGWYAGYWASMINYSYLRLGQGYSDRGLTVFDDKKSIENDVYAGYTWRFGEFSASAGLTGYLYVNGKHADNAESRLTLGYKTLTLAAQTFFRDSLLGNAGDTYWSLNYRRDLPYGFSLDLILAWSSYRREGKFYGSRDTYLQIDCGPGAAMNVTGCFAGKTPRGQNFSHLTLGLNYRLPTLPATLGVAGIIGGYNRFGVAQDNEIIGSLSLNY